VAIGLPLRDRVAQDLEPSGTGKRKQNCRGACVLPKSQMQSKGRYPFFILGCVRSGTTLLRDVLRRHPNLASPEETHFYRWADPFGTEGSFRNLKNNPVLKMHRELDGISENEFKSMLAASTSRADLYRKYMRRYMRVTKPGAVRWFDKTPQNVYGAAMIAAEFPKAKFIHIVRNPVNVVSSLRIGKVVKVDNLVGACSYWNEAVEVISVLKRAFPKRVYEVRYEDFTRDFHHELKKVLDFVGEEFVGNHYKGIVTRTTEHEHGDLFTAEELETIRVLCGPLGERYGYFR